MSDLAAFQEEARTWLDANCPESMRGSAKSTEEMEWGGKRAQGRTDDRKVWLDRMGSQGWICPRWPTPLSPSAGRPGTVPASS